MLGPARERWPLIAGPLKNKHSLPAFVDTASCQSDLFPEQVPLDLVEGSFHNGQGKARV